MPSDDMIEAEQRNLMVQYDNWVKSKMRAYRKQHKVSEIMAKLKYSMF